MLTTTESKMRTRRQILMFLAIAGIAALMTVVVYTGMPIVYADTPAATPAADTSSDAKINKVMSIIYPVLKYLTIFIGGFMIISGIIAYVIAKQNDNGPDEHKAIVKMAVGSVLVMLFTVILNQGLLESMFK